MALWGQIKTIQNKIKCRIKAENSCYYWVQHTFFSSQLLSKNLKITINKTTTLPVVLYGCEAWSLTLRKERKLRVLKTGYWGEYYGPRGMRMGSGEGSQ